MYKYFRKLVGDERNESARLLFSTCWVTNENKPLSLSFIKTQDPIVIFHNSIPVGFFVLGFDLILIYVEIIKQYQNTGIVKKLVNDLNIWYALCNKHDNEPWSYWDKLPNIERIPSHYFNFLSLSLTKELMKDPVWTIVAILETIVEFKELGFITETLNKTPVPDSYICDVIKYKIKVGPIPITTTNQ